MIPFIMKFIQHPYFKLIGIGAGVIGAILIAFNVWLGLHDRNIRNTAIAETNMKWERDTANARHVTVIDTNWIDVPAKAPVKNTRPAVAQIPTTEHQRRLDSAKADWEAKNADKDSIIALHTQNRSTTIADTTEKGDTLRTVEIGYYPLGAFGVSPLSFVTLTKERARKVPEIHSKTTLYIAPDVPWYKSPTFYYTAGIVTAGVIYYTAKEVRK